MSDASPPRDSDAATVPPDDVVARIAAIDDYLAGQADRDALAAAAAADMGPADFGGLLDAMLLLRQSAAAAGITPVPPPCDAPRHIGRYEIIGRAGEGGFATVWEAWDPLLRRRVALKVRRPETLLSAPARRRFVREAEIASRLAHPHVVTIYEVAAEDGREFIAQEFCSGGSLADWLARHPGPCAPRTAARLVLALARAAAYAHGAGVIHRDIKPANILLVPVADTASESAILAADAGAGATGFTVKLADFGLGKALADDGTDPLTQLTRTGASLGTPAWMAPEQIDRSFGPVGPATDVHGLGLLLDRLLTGRLLRSGGTTAETYRQVLFDDAEPADRAARGVPRDLAAVVLECLAKRPEDRYASAALLADDLERWLDGRPTAARPISAVARLARRVTRRPALTALAAGGLLAVALAVWATADRSRETRRAAANQAELARRDAVAEIRRGFEALRAGNVAAALGHLDATRGLKPALADSMAGRWLTRRTHGEREILLAPAVGGSAGEGRPRDLHAIALAPDGRTAAVAGADGSIRLVRHLDGRPTTTVVPGHDEVNAVSFSPDGKLLASVGQDGRLRWWQVAGDGLVPAGEARPGAGPLYAVAFMADGGSIACGGEDRVIRLLPLAAPHAPRELFRFEQPPGKTPEVESLVAVADDGLAASCGDVVVLLDATTGQLVREFEIPDKLSRNAVLGSLAVSPDGGRLVACGTDAQAHVWDIATGRPLVSLPEHPGWVQGCCFSADGGCVATACRDGGVRIFAADTAAPIARFLGHVGRVWSVASEPAGTLLTAGADGTLRRWDPRGNPDAAALRELAVPDGGIEWLVSGPPAAEPTGESLLAVTSTGQAWHVDLATATARPLADVRAMGLDYDRRRRRLAFSSTKPVPVEVVPYATEATGPATPVRLPAAVSPAYAILCWSPEGELVIVARDGALFVCPPDLRAVEPLAMLVDPVHDVAPAPAGPARVAAAGRRTAIVPLPDGRGRAPEPRLLDLGEDSSAVAWSPDGGTVAFGTRTGRVLIFEAATGAARGSLTAHERKIEDLCFSPDGLCLVTADQDCVRLSEVATLTTFDEIRPGWEVRAIAVTADGGRLAIAGRDAETTRDSRARLVVMEFDRP